MDSEGSGDERGRHMKITSGDVIRDGERELIDAITADLDWGAIERIFKEKHRLGIREDVEYKNGELVVHDNQIAYRLDFDITVTLSLLLDRKGNYLSITSSGDLEEDQHEEQDASSEDPAETSTQEEAIGTGQRLEDVMVELDESDGGQDPEMTLQEPSHEETDERISRAVSQAVDMIDNMD